MEKEKEENNTNETKETKHRIKLYALALKDSEAPYSFITNTGFEYKVYSDRNTADTERRYMTPSLANDLHVVGVELGW